MLTIRTGSEPIERTRVRQNTQRRSVLWDFLGMEELLKHQKRYVLYTPKLRKWDFRIDSNDPEQRTFICRLTYDANKTLHVLELPLFAKRLTPIPIIASTVTPTSPSLVEQFLSFLQQPLVRLGIGLVSFANLLNLIWKIKTGAVATSLGKVFILQSTAVGFAMVYFAGTMFAIKVLPGLKSELHARFDIIENLLTSGKTDESLPLIYNLGLRERIILHRYFPFNSDLRYRRQYHLALLEELCNSHHDAFEAYDKALALADSEHKRFLCLRGILNSIYEGYKQFPAPTFNEDIAKYVKQLPFVTQELAHLRLALPSLGNIILLNQGMLLVRAHQI